MRGKGYKILLNDAKVECVAYDNIDMLLEFIISTSYHADSIQTKHGCQAFFVVNEYTNNLQLLGV